MQKLYMNAANHSGPHLFFAHLHVVLYTSLMLTLSQ